MRVFLTGATGYVGGPVLEALLRGGHQVDALVRNNAKAARIAARGARPVIGNLAEPESFRAAAEGHDGYVHAALDRTPGRTAAIEKLAIETIIGLGQRAAMDAAEPPKKCFIIFTSGMWVLGQAPQPIAEDAPTKPIAMAAHRPEHEQ